MLQLMGDPEGELTKALDMELTQELLSLGLLGRCKRHTIYSVDGEIKAVNIAEKRMTHTPKERTRAITDAEMSVGVFSL